MTIEEKNYVTISFPCPKSIHKQLKTVAASKGKTVRAFLIETCIRDVLQQPENKKLLANLG